jgi:tetratricopeptide (TPR) repeat protein
VASERRAVVVRGAAGMGKSRLAEWVARRADEVGSAVVVRAGATAEGAGTEGIARLVVGAVGGAGLDAPALEERLSSWLAARGVRDPWVARGLAALVWPEHGGVRFATATERYALVGQLLDALVAYQDDEGALRPVVLWLDDVQWGGDLISLARHLLARGVGAPVLVLLTARDEALAERPTESAALEALEVLEEVQSLRLGVLSRAERTELVQRLLMLEGELAEQVEQRTGGNPLFAVQLVGDWVARGVLEVSDHGFVLAPGESARLPDDIHGLWTERIARLREGDPGVRPALELAALLGQRIVDDQWRDACERGGRSVPPGLVDELLGARLALSEPDGWSFAHGMLRESLERSAVESGRATALHAACARMLRERREQGGVVDLEARLGRHLVGAGALEEAVEPLRRAAAARRGHSEYAGALVALDRREGVLRALEVPPTDARWGEGWVERAALMVGMGRLEEAEALARRVIGTSGPGWATLWPPALRHAATALAKRGQLGPADELLRRGEQAAEQAGDRVERARCALFLGDVSRLMGRWDEATERCRDALARFEALGDVRGQADALQGLAAAAAAGGDHEAAEAWGRAAIPLFEQAGARFGLASAQNSLGDALRARCELGQAEEAYRQAESLLRRLGSPEAHVPRINLGFVLLSRGRYPQARAQLEPVLGSMVRLGRRGMEGALHAALLPCVADAGDLVAFRAHLDAAFERLEASGLVDPDIAEVAELGAELAFAAGAVELGVDALELAREQWRQLGDTDRLERVERALALRS